MTQRSGPGDGRGNTIGQTAPQLRETLERFDQGGGTKADRRYTRLPFRAVSLPVTLTHPGGNEASLRLACRNISRRGMGFLHSAFVYPGTRIKARLPRLDGVATTLGGAVVRCDHREGVVHEIGVRLDDPIELSDFLRARPLNEPLSYESVRSEDLFGTLVYLDSGEANARVIKHFLRETPMRIHHATDPEQGAELARGGCDIVLVGQDPGTRGQGEAIAVLRNRGVRAAVVVTGPRPDDATRMMLRAAGADRFLESPFQQRELLRHVAEFVLEPRSEREAVSEDQHTTAALLASLGELGESLLEQSRAGRAMDAYAVCEEIRQTAGALGLEQASAQAGILAKALGAGGSTRELSGEIRALLRSCGVPSNAA